MADPRGPVEVAKYPTQFEAETVAEVVRSEGIEATVMGGPAIFAGALGAAGMWSVMVAKEDADRAREASARSQGASSEEG